MLSAIIELIFTIMSCSTLNESAECVRVNAMRVTQRSIKYYMNRSIEIEDFPLIVSTGNSFFFVHIQ